MNRLRWLSPLLVLTLGGCIFLGSPDPGDDSPRPMPSVTQAPETIDQDGFWAIIDEIRGQGDPVPMAAALDARLFDADDQTLRTYEDQLAAATEQLYTWRHGEAAELICGTLDPDDGFLDWRVWVISLGRVTFDRVVADPDAIAEVPALRDGCTRNFDQLAWTAARILSDRHPGSDYYSNQDMRRLEPDADPAGVRLHGDSAIRAALPKVAART